MHAWEICWEIKIEKVWSICFLSKYGCTPNFTVLANLTMGLKQGAWKEKNKRRRKNKIVQLFDYKGSTSPVAGCTQNHPGQLKLYIEKYIKWERWRYYYFSIVLYLNYSKFSTYNPEEYNKNHRHLPRSDGAMCTSTPWLVPVRASPGQPRLVLQSVCPTGRTEQTPIWHQSALGRRHIAQYQNCCLSAGLILPGCRKKSSKVTKTNFG